MPLQQTAVQPPESHPPLGHLALLVFEAVLEVVCVSLPGYIVARLGYFDADKQKFLANLNVQLFTPCLIFTKLASQLNAQNLADLAVIPVIFVVQTLVSWLVAVVVARAFGFNRRASNFVIAMGVFGNSNSLPISLVLSLSQTIRGLHWDRIPGDNDDEVGARGILYLLIFQQLGQLVRWTWGYHVLLAPKEKYEEYQEERIEEGHADETTSLLRGPAHGYNDEDSPTSSHDDSMHYDPAGRTPVVGASRASPADSENEDDGDDDLKKKMATGALSLAASHSLLAASQDEISSFPRIRNADETDASDGEPNESPMSRLKTSYLKPVSGFFATNYKKLPAKVRTVLWVTAEKVKVFFCDFMNPPLWGMLLAVCVASVPDLQRLFFEEGSFIRNSVTNAVRSSAGVAVPLILVVLGANLARNTQATENVDPEEAQIGKKLLIASLISRMFLPTLIMAPILALMAKYVPVSILDDPIFVIVCFLLTGAPSALQLAQICQLNGVYEGVMSKILFQSYVIW